VRLAYADPPYPGQAEKHYGNHPDYAGEVDHTRLIYELSEFDGWALSTNSKSLQNILSLCSPGVRIIVWIKRSAPPFPKHGIYGWEPVIVSGARPPEDPLRDWLICEPDMFTFRPKPANHVVGQKPIPFCEWLFRWLGARAEDEFHDMFSGSGAVMAAWIHWRSQPELIAARRMQQQSLFA
jgi:hypothetical protein